MANTKSTSGMNNVVKIPITEVAQYADICIKAGEVPAFFGPPGIGKTSVLSQRAEVRAKKLGLKFNPHPTAKDWDDPTLYNFATNLLSQMEELDTRGLPHVITKPNGEQVTVYTPSELFPTNPKAQGEILLDEFANGHTRVQNSMQQIILEHAAGTMKLAPDVKFIIAGNRPDDNTAVNFIPMALRNRIAWFEVSKDKVESWLEAMEEIGQPINASMAAFMLSEGKEYYDNFKPETDLYAYGTMRSIQKASRIIEGIEDHKQIEKLVGAFMGADAGKDFVSFLRLTEKVDMVKVLNNPSEIHKYEDNLGLLYSICINLIDKAVESQANAEKVLAVIGETNKREHGVFVIKGIMNKMGAKANERIVKCKNAPEVMTKYHQVLKRITALNTGQ